MYGVIVDWPPTSILTRPLRVSIGYGVGSFISLLEQPPPPDAPVSCKLRDEVYLVADSDNDLRQVRSTRSFVADRKHRRVLY